PATRIVRLRSQYVLAVIGCGELRGLPARDRNPIDLELLIAVAIGREDQGVAVRRPRDLPDPPVGEFRGGVRPTLRYRRNPQPELACGVAGVGDHAAVR